MQKKRSDPGLVYRPDIDGLRGISILLVLAYHFNLPWITGGYIGVDVFFVISGYLITQLLQLHHSEKGRFLKEFYLRRIKRLLPLFLVVVSVATIMVTFVFLPEDYIGYFKSLRSALLFQSNIFFSDQISNYFGPDAADLPLLHTWSLSIEWQFYLLFPFLYIFIISRFSEKTRKILVFSLALGLTLTSIYITQTTGSQYFSSLCRFFELFIGACLPFIRQPVKAKHANVIIYICIAILLVLSVCYTRETLFPGVNALYVCLITAIFIMFGNGNTLLTCQPLVHIGKMSYSIYLWHWLFVAAAHYNGLIISTYMAFILIGIVMVLSHFSYRYVETPGRRSDLSFVKTLSLIYILPVLLAALGLNIIRINKGFPLRLGNEYTKVYQFLLPYTKARMNYCHNYAGDDADKCILGDKSAATQALFLGDSHANHYSEFVDALAKDAHVKVTALTFSECLMLPGAIQGSHWSNIADCMAKTQQYYQQIQQKKFKYVFLSQRWAGYSLAELGKLDSAIADIIAGGARPIIMGPVAEDGTNKQTCFYQHIKFRRVYEGECYIEKNNPFVKEQKDNVAQLFKTLQKKYPELLYIDIQAIQCSQDKCQTVVDGFPIYEDTHHINGFGARWLAEEYKKTFANPLVH